MWGVSKTQKTARGRSVNVSKAWLKRPERAILCEIGGFFGSGLDIRRRGSRLSILPGERLFPLSGSCTHIPDFIISRLLYLASIPFFRLYLSIRFWAPLHPNVRFLPFLKIQ